MSLSRLLFVLLLLVGSWSGYYLYDKNSQPEKQIAPDKELPIFTGGNLTNTSFNENGVRNYRVYSTHLEYFAQSGETHFYQPIFTVFREGETEEWRITSNQATLSNKNELLMEGDVVVHNLLPDATFTTMKTESLQLELITKDFMTEEDVFLVGPMFETMGHAMKGNFDSHNAELYNSVQGRYEAPKN
jgi:lipopolysaccharide export system protein LptC